MTTVLRQLSAIFLTIAVIFPGTLYAQSPVTPQNSESAPSYVLDCSEKQIYITKIMHSDAEFRIIGNNVYKGTYGTLVEYRIIGRKFIRVRTVRRPLIILMEI